ncbi:hypothetical protein B0H13DRAFT_1894483 [Mycena leptocephala]|nr:hypothetical protein B0H13DRAFT_1894483 [Mycena leptocephala]
MFVFLFPPSSCPPSLALSLFRSLLGAAPPKANSVWLPVVAFAHISWAVFYFAILWLQGLSRCTSSLYVLEWFVVKSCIALRRGGDPDVEQPPTQLEARRTGSTLAPFATWAGSQP